MSATVKNCPVQCVAGVEEQGLNQVLRQVMRCWGDMRRLGYYFLVWPTTLTSHHVFMLHAKSHTPKAKLLCSEGKGLSLFGSAKVFRNSTRLWMRPFVGRFLITGQFE